MGNKLGNLRQGIVCVKLFVQKEDINPTAISVYVLMNIQIVALILASQIFNKRHLVEYLKTPNHDRCWLHVINPLTADDRCLSNVSAYKYTPVAVNPMSVNDRCLLYVCQI